MDPGFVHRRKIQTLLGPQGMQVLDDLIRHLPLVADWEREVRIDHVYKDVFLEFCRIHQVKSLPEALLERHGTLVCSTERLQPCQDVYDAARVVSVRKPSGLGDPMIEFHYSTKLIASDTLRSRLHDGDDIAVVAELYSATPDLVVFHPILMGFPWLRSSDPAWQDKIVCWSRDFFENFVEDFDEFAKVSTLERPVDVSPMQAISEPAFKRALAMLLGDAVSKDWGGETSDHFTASLRLKGKRLTAAFLLKGPARFCPMGLNHLGKNNDQIFRLAQEPADLLVVQHCHDILPPVRATLRAFAVRPHGARRYCLMDGRDSLWLLKAYGLYESAVAWSKETVGNVSEGSG